MAYVDSELACLWYRELRYTHRLLKLGMPR
jgi:hypothetical protein